MEEKTEATKRKPTRIESFNQKTFQVGKMKAVREKAETEQTVRTRTKTRKLKSFSRET